MKVLRRTLFAAVLVTAIGFVWAPSPAFAQDPACGGCQECDGYPNFQDCNTIGHYGCLLEGCDGPCFYPGNSCEIISGTCGRNCWEANDPEVVADVRSSFARRAVVALGAGAETPKLQIDLRIPGSMAVVTPISTDIPPAGVSLTEWVSYSRRASCPTQKAATAVVSS